MNLPVVMLTPWSEFVISALMCGNAVDGGDNLDRILE